MRHIRFDKPVVFPEDVPAALSAYDCADATGVRVLGGVPNVTFAATCGSDRYAVRFCNNGYTSDAHLECEVRLLRHLEGEGFAKAPRVVAGKDGRDIQAWGAYRMIAMRFVDGVGGDAVPATRRLCADVGDAVARLRQSVRGFDHRLPPTETFRARSVRLMELLPGTAAHLGWSIDPQGVAAQWAEAILALERLPLPSGVIHTDIWPPNIVCREGRVVAVVDFDDLAYGPSVIDLAAALAEFAIGANNGLDEARAYALVRGFCDAGGSLTLAEQAAIVPGVQASSSAWLACNALHQVSFSESVVYADRLQWLGDAVANAKLGETLAEIYGEASRQSSD